MKNVHLHAASKHSFVAKFAKFNISKNLSLQTSKKDMKHKTKIDLYENVVLKTLIYTTEL